MSLSTVIKIIIAVFWGFVIFATFISNNLTTKMITNVNVMLEKQKFQQLKFVFHNAFNETFARKNIISRNIFNRTGEIPPEDLELAKGSAENKNFSKVPCAPASESLPVEVIGIIFTGNPKTNLVTVKDPDLEGGDVYHEGDKILDYPNYSVYRVVNSTSVEFQYGVKKICRSLVFNHLNVIQNSENKSMLGQTSESTNNTNTITLTKEYVNEELGKGLSKIINTGHIAPVMVDGKIEGFKIFSIAEGSLFDKIGLMNDDVITEINEEPLNDPAKGFLIYDSFQYENQITFGFKRGTKRMVRKVIISK